MGPVRDEGKKVDMIGTGWNVESPCGFLSEKAIEEVMVKTGLVEEEEEEEEENHHHRHQKKKNDHEAAAVAAPEGKLDDMQNGQINKYWMMSFENEEPMRGWIWYPYTDKELMRLGYREDEVSWEVALWNWEDSTTTPGISSTPPSTKQY